MMFLGYNFLGDTDSLSPTYNDIRQIEKLRLQNGIYDHIDVQKGNQSLSTIKNDWTVYNILLATCDGNLNGGNVNFAGMIVKKLRIRRRKIDDFENWYNLKEFDYDPNKQYEFYDNLTESNQGYEYAIIPVTETGEEGDYITSTVTSLFDGAFLCEKETSYKLLYNMEYSDTTRVRPSATFEPIDSKFPIVVRNGNINYEKGSLKALVLSEATEESYGEIDRKQEVIHRKALLDCLTNGETKVLKDSNGNYWVIQIDDNPSVSYLNELSQGIAEINISWVEVAENTKADLYAENLIASAD
jgi:hypothetical protein